MREYFTIFMVAMVVTYLLCVVAREIATRTGAVARVRQRDMHDVPVPYFGGLAMCGGWLPLTSWPDNYLSCPPPTIRCSVTPEL